MPPTTTPYTGCIKQNKKNQKTSFSNHKEELIAQTWALLLLASISIGNVYKQTAFVLECTRFFVEMRFTNGCAIIEN